MSKIKNFLRRAVAAFDETVVKRTLRTFGYAFLTVTITGYLGWLNDLTAWATSGGQRPFPEADNLTYLTVSGIAAGMIAVFNGLYIWLENIAGAAPLREVEAPVSL